jgi:hypothetical protein
VTLPLFRALDFVAFDPDLAEAQRPAFENGPQIDHRNPVNKRERTALNKAKTPIIADFP